MEEGRNPLIVDVEIPESVKDLAGCRLTPHPAQAIRARPNFILIAQKS